jgi:hypothetical protein
LREELPVPDAVRAVAVLAVGFFSVHLLLTAGTALDCYGRDVLACMEDLRGVVGEAPMLAVLFLALRLQAVRTAETEPPMYARFAMEVAGICLILRIGATVFSYADDAESSHHAQVFLAVVGFIAVGVAIGGTYHAVGLSVAVCAATVALAAMQSTLIVLYELARLTPESTRAKVLHVAQHTLSPAPMLAIGFLAVEVQREADYAPTSSAQAAVYVAAVALLTASVLVLGAQLLEGERTGGHVAMENKVVAIAIKVSIPVCLVTMFGAFCVMLYEVLKGPLGPQGVSAALTNLLVLSILFFGVYFAAFMRVAIDPEASRNTFLATARRGVATAPMVGVVIVAARMRALALNPNGGPPGWCMDAMYACTCGVAVTLAASSAQAAVLQNKTFAATVSSNVLTTLGFVLHFGGVLTLLGAIFTMRPALCTGKGSLIHSLVWRPV